MTHDQRGGQHSKGQALGLLRVALGSFGLMLRVGHYNFNIVTVEGPIKAGDRESYGADTAASERRSRRRNLQALVGPCHKRARRKRRQQHRRNQMAVLLGEVKIRFAAMGGVGKWTHLYCFNRHRQVGWSMKA